MQRLKTILQSKAFIVLSLIFLICYVIFFTKIVKYKSHYNIQDTNLVGTIINYKIDGDKLSIVLKAKEKVQINYYISSLEEKKFWQKNMKFGILIRLSGTFKVPYNNTIPNTFNYKKYLYNNKIYYTFLADKIEIEDNRVSILYKIKNAINKRITSFDDAKEYMQAFILGNNDYIDESTYQLYKINGVTHLFAVSGMHISFLVEFIKKVLKKIKIRENIIELIILIFLLFYNFLVGFSASVVRASLLFFFLLINKKTNLKLNNLMVLYLLFLILLIIQPFYIYNIGFLYSYITSFGLILFSSKIKGNYWQKTLLVSLIAFLFSLPITLLYFYEFNFLTILNNIIIVPIVSVILFPLSLLTFIFPFLEIFLKWGFELLESINLILGYIKLEIVVPKINVLFIVIYYALLFLIFEKGFKYVMEIILLISCYKLSVYLDFNSYVYFLDVGQGDSSLIISANRKDVILIDTGGVITYEKDDWQKRNSNFNLTDNIVLFLKSLGITKLDLLVISHGDFDHLGYGLDLVDKLEIKQMMFNDNSYNNNELTLAKKSKKIIKDKYIGKNVLMNNINDLITENENDSSLVLNIKLDNFNLLYMGDAPKKVENEVMKKYDIHTDILKIGHHGSNTSSSLEFLKMVNPKISIISAGRGNRYNHPHQETLDNLKKLNLQYYTTKEEGTIQLVLKKEIKKIIFYTP